MPFFYIGELGKVGKIGTSERLSFSAIFVLFWEKSTDYVKA